jgi:hypothetical protein
MRFLMKRFYLSGLMLLILPVTALSGEEGGYVSRTSWQTDPLAGATVKWTIDYGEYVDIDSTTTDYDKFL